MILDGDAWDIDDEAKLYLKKVLSNSQRLLDLINDMLDVQKLESWQMEFNIETINIKELLQSMYDNIEPLAKEKHQELILNNNVKNLKINTDYNKLLQVMINLAWNAVKFTPNWWKITIDASNDDKYIYISVEDNGIWISKENQDKIFKKFGQIKNSLTRDIEWTWLWLSIVLSIIEKLNWKIELKSQEWKGSKFVVILPLK